MGPCSERSSQTPKREMLSRGPAGFGNCVGVWPAAVSVVAFESSTTRSHDGQIWMLTLYAKNVVENIPAHILRKIREEIDGDI